MSIRIISSNIRFDNPRDGEHDWSNRRQILSNNLNEFNADLIGTQEGRRPQLEDFESLLTGFELNSKHRDWIEERMYPSLYTKGLNIVESGDFWLSKTPSVAGSKSFESAFPRLCTWVKAIIENKEITFFNVHLDHLKHETRDQQIDVFLKESQRIVSNYDYSVLLGDFNEAPQSSVHKKLEQAGLVDHWGTFHHEDLATHHNFGEFAEYSARIDWILLGKKLKMLAVFADKNQEKGIYPSDHYPIKAEVQIL